MCHIKFVSADPEIAVYRTILGMLCFYLGGILWSLNYRMWFCLLTLHKGAIKELVANLNDMQANIYIFKIHQICNLFSFCWVFSQLLIQYLRYFLFPVRNLQTTRLQISVVVSYIMEAKSVIVTGSKPPCQNQTTKSKISGYRYGKQF